MQPKRQEQPVKKKKKGQKRLEGCKRREEKNTKTRGKRKMVTPPPPKTDWGRRGTQGEFRVDYTVLFGRKIGKKTQRTPAIEKEREQGGGGKKKDNRGC